MTPKEALEYIAKRDYIAKLGTVESLQKWVLEFVEVAKIGLKEMNK